MSPPAELGTHVHVIPVDVSLSIEEAWRELCLMGVRATFTGGERWAVVECDGVECAGIAESPDFEVRAG